MEMKQESYNMMDCKKIESCQKFLCKFSYSLKGSIHKNIRGRANPIVWILGFGLIKDIYGFLKKKNK